MVSCPDATSKSSAPQLVVGRVFFCLFAVVVGGIATRLIIASFITSAAEPWHMVLIDILSEALL
jgi:hypothetical protein